MLFRNIAAAAAAIALAAAGSASAAVTQLTFTNAPSTGAQIYFNGLNPGTDTVHPGLSATLVLTLTSVTNGGYTWNFGYQLANTSSVDSTLSLVAFDVGPDFSSASGVSGVFTGSGAGGMQYTDAKDFCLKGNNGANCTGGGSVGLEDGASGTGTFSLNFASQTQVGAKKGQPIFAPVAAPTSVTLDDFAVRYQSVQSLGMTIGRPDVPPPTPDVQVGVPEPQTWAMLILGFFGMGAAVRRRGGLRHA